jgi:hypothetical protein
MKLTAFRTSVASIAALIFLCGCGKSSEQVEAEQRALDADITVVSTCTFDAVYPVSISLLSGQETAAVCDKMARSLGRNPTVKLLRHLSKAVASMKLQGYGDDIVGNAYQFMRVAEGRGQLKNDDAMFTTFDVVFKIVNGTDGRVMPKDLNIFLTRLGKGARTMSDEGLINSAAMLSVMKQDQGG